jgi:hypothetical protein
VGKDLDWVDYFDKAYYNAVVYGTGFIRVSVNGPEGLSLSVVDPKDYRYLMEEPPSTWVGLTDEEQSFVYDQVKQIVDSKPFWVKFADAIEAKLKEKNT